jgi:hypothetical protein
VFTADFRSNLLTVVQTATNSFTTVAASADGTFACGTKTPGQNLEDQGGGWWQGDFMVEQNSFTLRFAGRDENGLTGGRWWGFPAGTTLATLPVSTNLAASDTSAGAATATVTAGPGDYTFRFNIQSGECMIRKRDRGNLLKNPSFESVNDYGNPSDWGIYHGNTAPSESYDAHSGTNSVVLNRLYEDWDNLGNIDQNVTLKDLGGQPFLVSAAFRCGGTAWHGKMVRIIIEWKDSSNSSEILREESVEVLNLGPAWQTAALETVVPTNKATLTAHILFKYDGAQVGETVLVDDAFAGIAASRDQTFDAWGQHDTFGPLSPDGWSVDSGKTILNTGEKVVGGVVICKYIEGTANNKAIELYNGTGADIKFKDTPYYLQQYDNGSSTPTVTIPLTNGTFYTRTCWRITRTFDYTNYPPAKDLKASSFFTASDALTFNGDDVIVLSKGSTPGITIVDRVGQVGNATGSLWSRMATDHTLVRNSTVTNGNTSPATRAFDLSEWTVLDCDDFTGLGTHSFTDPEAGSLPSGYSLLLNTNATLSSPTFDGGIGDISFLARAQANPDGAPLTLLVETAVDEYSTAWTLVASNSIPSSQTAFTRYECAANNANHTAVRFRHVSNGTTNRDRLDDISIGRHYSVKRTENFAGWTDPVYATDGTYSIAQWTLNGHIAANGVAGTLAGNLPVEGGGSVRSPTFAGGVGQVSFTLCRTNTSDTVQVLLESSSDGGNTWTEEQSFKFAGGSGTATNLSSWVYIPSNGCVRFTCNGGTADAILDNISVGMPSIPRELNFDDFAVNSSYKVSYSYKGWEITGVAIVGDENGNSGLIQNGTISSPCIDSIGSLSFVYRNGPYDGDEKARLKVEVSQDAKTWTTITASLAGNDEWQSYGYWFPTNSNWHYVRITQTTKDKRMLLDDITLADFAPVPSVAFSSGLEPTYPVVKQPFRLTASAYPRNGADILSVTGYVKYASTTTHWTPLEMTDEGAGDWASEYQPGRNGGNSIISYATVWYGGVGVVPGNPGYGITNLSTPATTVTVSSVKSGEVWINEFSYSEMADEFWSEDEEFVEICGVAGTDITGWKVQLAYALAADIAANSNNAVYATYVITNSDNSRVVLTNDEDSGHGFWLLADNNSFFFGDRIDRKLDTLDPIDPENDPLFARNSHIHNASGVIRLLNQYGGVVQSLSYGAWTSGSDRIPESQAVGDSTSLSLAGSGNLCQDFTWTKNDVTPGAANAHQTLTNSVAANLMPVWHKPDRLVTIVTTNNGVVTTNSFTYLNPLNAGVGDAIKVYVAYTNNDFPTFTSLMNSKLHHRLQGSGEWETVGRNPDDHPTDGDGISYLTFGDNAGSVPHHTYHRFQTMEYVIETSYIGSKYDPTFLGTEDDGKTCTAYATFKDAAANPFTHFFGITETMEITNIVFAADGPGTIRICTIGNDDEKEPLGRNNFRVRSTTNLFLSTNDWDTLDFEYDRHDGTSQGATWPCDDFILTPPAGPARHFAIQAVE